MQNFFSQNSGRVSVHSVCLCGYVPKCTMCASVGMCLSVYCVYLCGYVPVMSCFINLQTNVKELIRLYDLCFTCHNIESRSSSSLSIPLSITLMVYLPKLSKFVGCLYLYMEDVDPFLWRNLIHLFLHLLYHSFVIC